MDAQSLLIDERCRQRPTVDNGSHSGTGGWRTGLHTQTKEWSPRMVWTWRVSPE